MPIFRCYDPSANGGGGIHSWYSLQDAAVRAAVDATLELMALERDWSDLPHYEQLRGACEGLGEIKVNLEDGRLIRVLGFEGPSRNEFTLLYGFDKGLGHVDYGPHCYAALWRKHAVERNNRRAPLCQFP